ncbi:MAG: DUF3990 domain-containing protein [Paraprevotella sp.]|nr:DUF3990 domain-containing protein [Paraprevotella sp.]
MKRLYHGSNVSIEQIDLSRSKRGKDFGQGFYLNANPDQAMEMGARTTRFLNEGTPTLSCFEFDEDEAIKNGLNIKVFPDYSEDYNHFNYNQQNFINMVKRLFLLVAGALALTAYTSEDVVKKVTTYSNVDRFGERQSGCCFAVPAHPFKIKAKFTTKFPTEYEIIISDISIQGIRSRGNYDVTNKWHALSTPMRSFLLL